MSMALGEMPADTNATLELRMEPSTGDMFSTDYGPDEIVAAVVGPSGTTNSDDWTGGMCQPRPRAA